MNHTNNTKLTTEQKRKILSYAISTLGIDIVAVDTAKKNKAKINKDIIWFKENKTQILAQNLTTNDYLRKVDNGCYDNGNGVCCGILRNGRFKDYALILLDIDKREGLEAFLNHGDRQESIEELADRH